MNKIQQLAALLGDNAVPEDKEWEWLRLTLLRLSTVGAVEMGVLATPGHIQEFSRLLREILSGVEEAKP